MKSNQRACQAADAARYRAGLPPGPIEDVPAVIRALGIRLLMYPLDDDSVEGAYVRRAGYPFIFLNTCTRIRYLARLRFTAAHELGHHFLSDEEADVAVYEVDAAKEDRIANEFARCFLMDAHSVHELVAGIRSPLTKALRVQERYGVSLDAAAIRLCDLGLITMAEKDGITGRDQNITVRQLREQCGLPAYDPPVSNPIVGLGDDYTGTLELLIRQGLVPPERSGELALGQHVTAEPEDFEIELPPEGEMVEEKP